MAILRIKKRAALTQSYQIADTVVVEVGDYVCLSSGRVVLAADTAGYRTLGTVIGFEDLSSADGTDTGDTSATPIPEAIVDIGPRIAAGLTVTGASAVTDQGTPVFITGEQTYTLTETSNIPAVGEVVRHITGTTCDVLMYSQAEMSGSIAGISKRRELLAVIHTTALEGTAAADLARWTARGEGRIVATYAKPTGFDAGYVAGSQTINLEIGTTNLTGGSMLVSHTDADAIGDVATLISGTAVTGANEFSDGDTVTIELATGGEGFTAAIDTVSFEVWADVEYGGA